MKISLNIAQNYSNVDLAPTGAENLIQKISSQLGEIESTQTFGPRYDGVLVAKVLKCEKHKNADKLSVCHADTGKSKVQVVCGAPNVREGMLAAWIPPGKIVPATYGKDPFTLEAREIRGIMSQGMLASPSELDISDDHEGILEIKPEDVGKALAKPGVAFSKLYGLDDVVVEIENKMFTHRPDCFGILGVARELAGIQRQAFKSPEWYLNEALFDLSDELVLDVQNKLPKLVPRFMAAVMTNIQVGSSPIWLQAALRRLGVKPINNIVDLTNFYMHLTGQPLHAYDYDKLLKVSSKPTASLETRRSKKGDRLKLLGGKEITFDDDSVVLITSGDVPVGIGGVMGGADTEVDESTKTIVLECASFDLYSVRRTSMKYGLFTDAVTRFSKGQSPLQNDRVLAQIIKDIQGLGGKLASKVVDDVHVDPEVLKSDSVHEPVQVSAEFINARLGLSLSALDIAKLLQNVEFAAEVTRGDVLIIKPPFWRTDIAIAEDVVEEVGRLTGYDNLPLELPRRTSEPARISELLGLKRNLASELSALGANEVLTYSFVHERLLEAAGQDAALAYKINNALSPDLQYYRLSLTPSLLEKVHPNIKAGFDSFALFELGKVHGKSELEEAGLPKELDRLSLVYTDKKRRQSAAYYKAQGLAKAVLGPRFTDIRLIPLRENKIKDHQMFNAMLAPFDPGRSALIFADDKLAGVVGEFKASVTRNFKLPSQTAGFELFLNPLAGQKAARYQPLSRYPSVTQDITLRTNYALAHSKIDEALQASLGKNSPPDVVISTNCVDIFSGDNSSKNTTFRITAFSYGRTLTTEVVNTLLDKVAADVKKSIKATRV